MGLKIGLVPAFVVVLGLTGCRKALAVGGASAPVAGASASVEVPAELATIVSTNGDEVVTFIEHATSPDRLSEEFRTSLLGPPPLSGEVREAVSQTLNWTSFARQTTKDTRATVLRRSKEGFLVVPTDWIAAVIRLPGAREQDVRTWRLAMSRLLAASGRANGLARFDNGNATAVRLELRKLARGDVALCAATQFFKAHEYDPDDFGPTIEGAESVTKNEMNDHDGISVFDLLRGRLRREEGSSKYLKLTAERLAISRNTLAKLPKEGQEQASE